MAGRACGICSSGEKIKIAAEMIAAGASDQAIADKLGVARSSAQRHRTLHVVKPARAIAEAAAKGALVKQERTELLAAAQAGDPVAAFIGLHGIVGDLRNVQERLERTAAAAEEDNQRLAVSALSAQQLRATEVRAKIGGIGAYAPQKAADGTGQTPFVLRINLGDRTVSIGAAPAQSTIDAEAEDAEAEDDDVDAREPHDPLPESSDAIRRLAEALRGIRR